jgi:hypothetical protein
MHGPGRLSQTGTTARMKRAQVPTVEHRQRRKLRRVKGTPDSRLGVRPTDSAGEGAGVRQAHASRDGAKLENRYKKCSREYNVGVRTAVLARAFTT